MDKVETTEAPLEQNPQQLNAKLRNLVNSIHPRISIEQIRGNRRNLPIQNMPHGETYRNLWDLTTFLEFEAREPKRKEMMAEFRAAVAKAPITSYFRQQLTARFDLWCTVGIDDSILKYSFYYLDQENPESGGIFDPNL